ncbi:MAG: homogentisate 1,2-dioxygenase [Acidimicrobiales bacterium]
MPQYRRVGDVPAKRHTAQRDSSSRLRSEELMGLNGFSEESALLYHENAPTAIRSAEAVRTEPDRLSPNYPLLARHLRLHHCKQGGDPVTGRQLILANDDVRISYVVATETSPLARNAIGDELAYIESGQAVLETVFGTLEVKEGDYVVIPASTTHRWLVADTVTGRAPEGKRPDDGRANDDSTRPVRILFAEATGHITVPDRYLSSRGQLKEGAPFSERDVRGPEGPLVVQGQDVEVLVRTRSGVTRYVYVHHPFDVVGWDGCLYPWALSIHDFEPIVGRVHQPPPVHQTFAGPSFVVCSFVPRPFDFGADSIPVPYNHANVDSDEVLFYCGGDFMSRAGSGIGQGSVSLHPSGFIHGPQPGSVEAALGKPGTNELAVMIDTFRPLQLGQAGLDVEDETYPWSWARPRE